MSVKFISLDQFHAYGLCELNHEGADFESQIKSVLLNTVNTFAQDKGYANQEASFIYVFEPAVSDSVLNVEFDFLSVNESHFSVECYVYRKLSNVLLVKSFHVFKRVS
jgi:hypothetical protein